MEKELLDQLIALGVNRPIQAYRMIGNRRIEVHCLGDYEPKVYVLGKATGEGQRPKPKESGVRSGQEVARSTSAEKRSQYTKAGLGKMTVAELKKIAGNLGIKIAGLRKAELIERISSRQE